MVPRKISSSITEVSESDLSMSEQSQSKIVISQARTSSSLQDDRPEVVSESVAQVLKERQSYS